MEKKINLVRFRFLLVRTFSFNTFLLVLFFIVCQQLIASTQNSLLSSLTLLLETSVDDNLTEILLKSLTTVLRLSCKLEMTAVRDAYLAALCKAALPSNYFSMIIPGGLGFGLSLLN